MRGERERNLRRKEREVRRKKKDRELTSNYIIAGNGRVPKYYLFILWLYLFKKYI